MVNMSLQLISSRLKSMIHLNYVNSSHECGQTCVARNAKISVLKVMTVVETNPFTTTNSTLINISRGQHAGPELEYHMTNVKEFGFSSLIDSISADQKKTIIARLKKL